LKPLITLVLPLNRVEEAFKASNDRKAVKVMVDCTRIHD